MGWVVGGASIGKRAGRFNCVWVCSLVGLEDLVRKPHFVHIVLRVCQEGLVSDNVRGHGFLLVQWHIPKRQRVKEEKDRRRTKSKKKRKKNNGQFKLETSSVPAAKRKNGDSEQLNQKGFSKKKKRFSKDLWL